MAGGTFPEPILVIATVSMLGIPGDITRVRLFAGATELQVNGIEQSTEDERVGIVLATTPPILANGQYDITALVEKDGLWQSAVLYGGLQVDAPLMFASLSPQWGPLAGGTRIMITGEGFEPGNTVMDGLTIDVGSLPARDIRVPVGLPGLATKTIRVSGRTASNSASTETQPCVSAAVSNRACCSSVAVLKNG